MSLSFNSWVITPAQTPTSPSLLLFAFSHSPKVYEGFDFTFVIIQRRFTHNLSSYWKLGTIEASFPSVPNDILVGYRHGILLGFYSCKNKSQNVKHIITLLEIKAIQSRNARSKSPTFQFVHLQTSNHKWWQASLHPQPTLSVHNHHWLSIFPLQLLASGSWDVGALQLNSPLQPNWPQTLVMKFLRFIDCLVFVSLFAIVTQDPIMQVALLGSGRHLPWGIEASLARK